MRRASRDYTKYLRGSEEMGGAGAPHEGPLHAPPPPATPAAAAASRSTFVALLGLGLGQVVCSVALFLYFRAQVSARPPGARGRGAPTSTHQRLAGGGVWFPPAGLPRILHIPEGKGTLQKKENVGLGVSRVRGPSAGLNSRARSLARLVSPSWARPEWCV